MAKKAKSKKSARKAGKQPAKGKSLESAAGAPAKRAKKVIYWETNVPEEFTFYVCDGRAVKNLKELTRMLDEMSDDIFSYHANGEKNDFSNWVRDIMHSSDLAHNLLGKNRHDCKETILLYVRKKTGKNRLKL